MQTIRTRSLYENFKLLSNVNYLYNFPNFLYNEFVQEIERHFIYFNTFRNQNLKVSILIYLLSTNTHPHIFFYHFFICSKFCFNKILSFLCAARKAYFVTREWDFRTTCKVSWQLLAVTSLYLQPEIYSDLRFFFLEYLKYYVWL